MGPAGNRACQRPHCSDFVFVFEITPRNITFLKISIRGIVERYVYNIRMCFAIVVMCFNVENSCSIQAWSWHHDVKKATFLPLISTVIW